MEEPLSWTLNCLLVGAKVGRLVDEGDFPKAKEELLKLTSQIDEATAKYILERMIKEE